MHGSSQGTPAPLSTFGGLVTLASPDSLPEGASPRCYDNDFLVGQTKTRDGLTSVYTYSGAAVGPSPGMAAVDTATGGIAWVDPTYVLLNDAQYATCALLSSSSVVSAVSTGTSTGGGVAWANPGNVDSTSSFATVTLSAGGGSYTPSVSTGNAGAVASYGNSPHANSFVLSGFSSVAVSSATLYVTLSGLMTLSGGTSVGQVVIDYSTNSGVTWTTARTWTAAFSSTTVIIPVTAISNLNTIQVRVTVYAQASNVGDTATVGATVTNTYATVPGAGGLNSQTLNAAVSGLTIPTGATIRGLGISFQGEYSGAAPTFSINLNVGTETDPFTLTTTPATYTAGGTSDLWGYGAWTQATLSALAAQFTAVSPSSSVVSVNSLRFTVYYSISALGSDALDVTHFGFSVPSTSTPQGFGIIVKGNATAAATLSVQMLKGGTPVGIAQSIPLSTAGVTSLSFGGGNNLFGSTWNYADLNGTGFGVRLKVQSTSTSTASLGYVTLAAYLLSTETDFNFITTFTSQDGTVRNLSLDDEGNFWIENVSTNPGLLTPGMQNITPHSHAIGVQGEFAEYLAFNDGITGSDIPRQYTPSWIDRITQVGPGASPAFAPTASTSNTFAITSITQPAAKSDPSNPGHFSVLLWSNGPGSTTAGNVVTVYYAPSYGTPGYEDTALVTAFNSGNPVYVYIVGAPFANGTYAVTSVGNALPPGVDHWRFYFTIQVPTSNYQNTVAAAGTYKQTLATMTTTVAVPGLDVGSQVTLTGTSVAGYNNVWTISQTLNSGEMAITETAVTAGVATYTYSLASGIAPVAGQLVTVTGTTNANGTLNVVNATIASATGGSSGSFTIGASVISAGTVLEQGQATTAGTIFAFDPGLATLGTMTSPIYGAATGGSLTFAGPSGQFIGVGTRQGTVFFITRNGYYTAPGPPVTFTCPSNTTAISATLIPIGPPNVIARGIAFTEAGQNGVPGANFFTIPTPVQYIVQNVKYTATSLIINDNTTTSATFFFTDSILLSAQAIDIYGYNLFNQIEIGSPGWIASYATRNFYGLCQNKIQNFINLSFDGGYLPNSVLQPLGWTVPDVYGGLQVSPVFGNSYYIQNTTAGELAIGGMISQTAYQDAYQQPILNANTTYSVRITARNPSGLTGGNLVVTLTGDGATFGMFTLPFASMSSAMAIYTGTLLTAPFLTIPGSLTLNLSATAMAAGADVEIDRLEIFPTDIPILGTTVYGSYAALPEQVDAVTGQGKFTSENQQPVMGAVVMFDTLYGLKGDGTNASMYSWQASPNLEPAQWEEPEVSQRAGACGTLAFDFGEQWLVEACRNGIYMYDGGQPGKIMQEIYQVWDAINWDAATSIWVRVDVTKRRLMVGIPLPTPNFWLPEAPVNSTPLTPNVILMLDFKGLDNAQEIKNSPQMHTTMFGTLNSIDMRRKWSIWQIPSPYGAIVQTATDRAFYICNGRANSKVYMLDPDATTDDGVAIDSLYTTYGFVNADKAQQMPMLGAFRKRWGYMTINVSGVGLLNVRFLPNQLVGPGDPTTGYYPWTVPGGFNLQPICLNDREASANFAATRTFVELRGPDFTISALTLHGKRDVYNALRGIK